MSNPPEPTPTAPAKAPAASRGRNLPLAIGAGLVLGGSTLASLLWWPNAFVIMAACASAWAVWELSFALAGARMYAPVIPLILGGLGIPFAAFAGGPAGLLTAYFLVCVATVVWVALDTSSSGVHNAGVGVFITTYVPLTIGFVMLLLTQHPVQGPLMVITYMSCVVANDIGGYTAGVLFGKRPMAAGVSPNKTWEGFAGSIVSAMVVGAGLLYWLLDVPIYLGLSVGVIIVFAATLGDLAESMIKRDLGIKDMGSAIPGHGGLMERLDSMLVAAPVAYVALSVLPL